jgi:hypothetical protein
LLKKTSLLTLLVALLILPSLVFAGSHKLAVGAAQVKADNLVTVPLEISNEANLMAADIPLRFSEGVTLKEVNFQGTRVENWDLKVSNINNETNTVIIGLLTQMSPKTVPDLAAGEGPVANLVFQVDDPNVKEITLESVQTEQPSHELTFIYHTVGANGEPVGQREERAEFTSASFSLGDGEGELPGTFQLGQNYPNPFNPSTEISFSLPNAAHVELDVFNVLGQKVRSLVSSDMTAGEHTVMWDGQNASGATVSSGVYFYRIAAGNFTDTKKMMMLK